MSTPQLVIFSQTFNIHHIPLIKPHLGTLDGERGGGVKELVMVYQFLNGTGP